MLLLLTIVVYPFLITSYIIIYGGPVEGSRQLYFVVVLSVLLGNSDPHFPFRIWGRGF